MWAASVAVAPVIVAPGDLTSAADAEAIFEQARRRRRRRRALAAAVVSVALTASAMIGLIIGGGHRDSAARLAGGGLPAVTAPSGAARVTLPAVRLAWVDENGDLNVGDPANGVRHLGPAIDASASAPLVPAGGQLYWSDSRRDVAPIRVYDPATAKIRYLARGESVFASPDGRRVYIAQSGSTLLELPANGSGAPTVLRVPAGWYVSAHAYDWISWEGTVAGGIVVYSSDDPNAVPGKVRAGIWNPATGHVRMLGKSPIVDAYTPPGASYSLLIQIPLGGGFPQNLTLRITNTSTLSAVTIRSPLHYGFAISGASAFSPDGRRLAIFARTARLGSGGMSELAIVTTSTGAVRLVPRVTMFTTEDAFWAIWLAGQRILVGTVASSYVVDARTLISTPFNFFSSTDGFSAVILSAR